MNDFLSSESSRFRDAKFRSSRKPRQARLCSTEGIAAAKSATASSAALRSAARGLLGTALLLACGSEEEGLTYTRNVRPIFSQRCTVCHRPDGPSGIDIQNPFSNNGGLVTSKNRFKELHPELNLPEDIVLPGDPDRSFLMYKIDESLGLPGDPDDMGPRQPPAGVHMPLKLPELEYAQVHMIEAWVSSGARPGMFSDPGAPAQPAVPASADRRATPARAAIEPAMRDFAADIQPIFGTEAALVQMQEDGGTCTPSSDKVCPRCIYCHYEGGPNLPDLTNVFNAQTGLVNAPARYRSDLKRVDPGNPEGSLLIQKLRYENFTTGFARSDFGAQMPYSYDPLSPNQIATVRQWILEGAKP